MRRLAVILACIIVTAGCKGTSSESSGPTATTSDAKPAIVVMAVNLGEEDETGGCGDVIHSVRAAAAKGIKTKEVDTRNKADLDAASKKYGITKQPTVIMLDANEHELRRYEGESKETLTALGADLERTAKK